jgi:hypothetical protein
MNESIHGERTASEPQDRVTELIEQQTASRSNQAKFPQSPISGMRAARRRKVRTTER